MMTTVRKISLGFVVSPSACSNPKAEGAWRRKCDDSRVTYAWYSTTCGWPKTLVPVTLISHPPRTINSYTDRWPPQKEISTAYSEVLGLRRPVGRLLDQK